MLQLVKVRLRKPKRVLVFTVRDLTLERDDTCIVRTEWGLEYGCCIADPEDCAPEASKRYTMSVVRKATDADEETVRQIEDEERQAAALCMRRIRERNLPMQVVDAEYTFDRHKVIVNFTADDRVDFRELVRDLAQDLKARIELRHIQVRDKAKIVGGLAGCGRELCCATWLGAFMPISMKMAKKQNLSLNPTKISGQCGRLMCCLSYENDMYEAPKKKKPQPQGEGAEDAETAEAASAKAAEGRPPVEKPARPAQAKRPQGKPAQAKGGPEKGDGAAAARSNPDLKPIEALDREDAVDAEDVDDEAEEDVEEGAEGAAGEQSSEGGDQKKRRRPRRRRKRRKGGSGGGTGGEPQAPAAS